MTLPTLSPTVRTILAVLCAAVALVLGGPAAVSAVCTALTDDPACGLWGEPVVVPAEPAPVAVEPGPVVDDAPAVEPVVDPVPTP